MNPGFLGSKIKHYKDQSYKLDILLTIVFSLLLISNTISPFFYFRRFLVDRNPIGVNFENYLRSLQSIKGLQSIEHVYLYYVHYKSDSSGNINQDRPISTETVGRTTHQRTFSHIWYLAPHNINHMNTTYYQSYDLFLVLSNEVMSKWKLRKKILDFEITSSQNLTSYLFEVFEVW